VSHRLIFYFDESGKDPNASRNEGGSDLSDGEVLTCIAPVTDFLKRPHVTSSNSIPDPNRTREVRRMGQDSECSRVALIVEDDKELRALAVALLEETDLRVVEASTAEEALHYLNYLADEVVFLFADVCLPSLMSGADLARTVRLKWPWIRTVLTSGAPVEDDLDQALRDVPFMPKPWRALEVLMQAEKAVQTSPFEEAARRSHIDPFGALRA
jgi:CheY-like chemotaxis protein